MMRSLIFLIVLFLFLPYSATASPKIIKSFDGFELSVFIDLPKNKTNPDTYVVIAHGSGPTSADGDLSSLTLPAGTSNKVYLEIAKVFNELGIAVVRYHKRAYSVQQKIKINPGYTSTQEFLKFKNSPLETLIKDFKFVSEYTRNKLKAAKVIAFGHSEGTQVALYALLNGFKYDGLVLAGLHNERQATLVFEQSIYRASRMFFDKLDENHNKRIEPNEYNNQSSEAQTIKAQVGTLDLNGDKIISINEFLAGNYSNSITNPIVSREYQIDEMKYPKAAKVIEAASIPMAVLVALNDNQTPPYQVMAMDFLNRQLWKKKNLIFYYLEQHGHGLGKRPYEQLLFSKIDTQRLGQEFKKMKFLF